MYPTFCRIPRRSGYAEPLFAEAAERLPGAWPALALGEQDDLLEALVGAEGQTARLPTGEMRPGLPDDVALALMDAVEEAIEDAHEGGNAARASRLEHTLALLEQAMGDSEGA